MIIAIQVLSKIIETKDFSMIENNDIDRSYFTGYESEFDFIDEHYKQYHNVPDTETFLSKFPNFDLIGVAETDDYLLSKLREQHLYEQFATVLNQGAEILQTDSFKAYDFILDALKNDLMPTHTLNDVGIVANVKDRIENYEYVNQNQTASFIPTGFKEIDADIIGFQRGEELVVFFARTNQGKSWVLEAMCVHAVEQGYKIGYFSPEMSATDIGYRFDTLHNNISNTAMKFGLKTDDFDADIYRKYGEELQQLTGELYVTQPKDFARKLTISKLRNWAITRKLDMIAIDGITYLTDERYKKGDSKTTTLTNISEDLMDLSSELKIPILVVVQANRGGVIDKSSLDTPELENIRDSDGIAMNASKVYSVRQVKDKSGIINLLIDNKKMRAGKMGQSYSYVWDIDLGLFESISKDSIDVGQDDEEDERPRRRKSDAPEPTASTRRHRKVEEDEY